MKHKLGLSTIEQKALGELKRRLEENFGSVLNGIRLFGSRARGDKHRESDIDILVIFENRDKEVEEKLTDIICEIVNEFGIYFEIVSYSRREYEETRRHQWPFILNLEREAITI